MSHTADRIAKDIEHILLRPTVAKSIYRASQVAVAEGDVKQNLWAAIDEILDVLNAENLRIANRYRKKLGQPIKEPEPFRYKGIDHIPINRERYGLL